MCEASYKTPLKSISLSALQMLQQGDTFVHENQTMLFKGTVFRNFYPRFFSHNSNPAGHVSHMLNYFRIWFQFRRDIRMCKKLCGVSDTAESDFLVSQKPWTQQQCQGHQGVTLCDIIDTKESHSVISLTPRSHTP